MSNLSKKSDYGGALPWIMFCVAALFYCFVYFLRVSPGMMSVEIQQHFHVTATKFAVFATVYYLAYSPMQLVVGAIIDRFGARAVLFSACVISLTGVYLFSVATNFYFACVARFLIGLGSAFGYVTILKVASTWLPPTRFAAAAGITTAFGMLAAIFTESYLAHAIQNSGLQQALASSLMFGSVLALLILVVLRNAPKGSTKFQDNKLSFRELVQGYKGIIRNPQTWYIGIVGALFYIPAMVFLDVYAPEYLQKAYFITKAQSAQIIDCMFAGWIIGAPTIGIISDHIKRRKLPLVVASITSTILITTILYAPHLSMASVYIIMVLLGFSCGAHPLVFALGKENSPLRLSGTATAFTNFLVMTGGFLLTIVGKLLDWHWDGTMLNGAPAYSLADYHIALAVIPVGLIVALLVATRINETYATMPKAIKSKSSDKESSDVLDNMPLAGNA